MPIQSDGDFVHTEILAKANFLTCWLDEIPIGASGNVRESKAPGFRFGGRWRDMRRVMRNPDFGASPVPLAASSAALNGPTHVENQPANGG
jgi:hypothetical protein